MRDEEAVGDVGLLPTPSSWFGLHENPPTNSQADSVLFAEVHINDHHYLQKKDSSHDEKATSAKSTTIKETNFEAGTVKNEFLVTSDHDSAHVEHAKGKKKVIKTGELLERKQIKINYSDKDAIMSDDATICSPSTRTGSSESQRVGTPLPSPSWTEISSQVLPAAAQELFSNSMRKLCHSARLSYAVAAEWRQEYQELGNPARGYFRNCSSSSDDFPPFSSLPWIERQMVQEWRTYNNGKNPQNEIQQSLSPSCNSDNVSDENSESGTETQNECFRSVGVSFDSVSSDELRSQHGQAQYDDEDEDEFVRARTLVPKPQNRPKWQNAETCSACYKPFGPTRLRHHCRLCGRSFCQAHSANTYPLLHLGYKIPERVCDECQIRLKEHDLAERVSWRLARCRDLTEETLCPYFGLGVDTMHDMAVRITTGALAMAKSIPLGAQATVAVETIEVLRRYGLNGIYTILLRQEFLAAADMLRKALGIDSKSWPLSVHELSAAIFYALAQHRALRGLQPDREQEIHAIRINDSSDCGQNESSDNTLLEPSGGEPMFANQSFIVSIPSEDESDKNQQLVQPEELKENNIVPVCDPLPDSTLNALIFYAPLALSFVYAEKEVDMQLLAAQQGWRLLYAFLQQKEARQDSTVLLNRPSSAVFVHEKHRIACLAIRGTATIHDVVTDIRQVPVPFPEPEMYKVTSEDWTTMSDAQGLAVSGMVGAALNLYREHVDSLLYLALEGYRIRLVGHSLGGAVATLIGVLLRHDFPALQKETSPHSKLDGSVDGRNIEDALSLRVYSYGTPACVDVRLSDMVQDFAVTAVLHDDVVPRLSPISCRGLLKHLLHIRDTWVKEHLPNDLKAITDRARLVWAPRWREGFTLLSTPSSSTIKRYCRKQYRKGKSKILSMKDQLLKAADEQFGSATLKELQGKSNGHGTQNGSANLSESSVPYTDESDAIEAVPETRLLVDYMGGIDHQTSGIVIDGDEFFEAQGSSLVEDECENFEDAVMDLIHEQEKEMSCFLQREHKENSSPDKTNAGCEIEIKGSDDDGSPGVVVLAETPLPRLYVPGRIAHIYSYRGVYRAVHVPRSFRELRQISMAGNMLTDHKCKSYYEALLEVRSARLAPENPPRWTAFDEDDTCACCASRFTWASTSNSEAQQARDKHNCRSCGTLVCDPCSSSRIPLPSIGLTCSVRVCDRCYHDLDGIINKNNNSVESAMGDMARRDDDKKPERVRQRRSDVVDELASRITAPGLL